MRFVAMGDTAWRMDLPLPIDRPALLAALRALPGVLDAVVTDRHALVRTRPGVPPPEVDVAHVSDSPLTPRRHVVRVRYDGPDLDEVARLLQCTPEEVVARHTSRDHEAQLVGFQPGFAYLGPVDELLARAPRRLQPRPRVQALSVGLAAGRTAIYPFDSPGGWQLLGTAVDFAPFSPDTGAAISLGDLVRFEAVR